MQYHMKCDSRRLFVIISKDFSIQSNNEEKAKTYIQAFRTFLIYQVINMKLFTKLFTLSIGACAASIAYDRIKETKEKDMFIPYGFPVETEYGNMRAIIYGDHGPTIVCLSGYGSPSPYLEYKPLVQELSSYSRVIVLELLGYGCSDNTDRPRTIENICDELYAALRKLKIEKCWLMPHSIAGVYSLYFVQKYVDMIEGILAIDPSLPQQIDYFSTDKMMKKKYRMKQTGLLRLSSIFSNEDDERAGYEKEDLLLINQMELWHTHDKVLKDEGNYIKDNLDKCRCLKFPSNLPVLMILASQNVEIFKDWWKDLHEQQLSSTMFGKLIVLEGTHFLHFTQSKNIAKHAIEFIQEH